MADKEIEEAMKSDLELLILRMTEICKLIQMNYE